MGTHGQLNVLRVFLASPGDLGDERRIAKKVVERLNKLVTTTGWRVELLGWEDTLPGAVRPQDKINADVDRCDLFVGLLWRRWGEPPGGGQWTSGFEEEFERAWARHEKTGDPEIWLFFKDIEEALRADPGEQLQRVLAFRQKMQREKKIFYKEFKDSVTWNELFEECIFPHVIDTSRRATHPATPDAASRTLPVPPAAQPSAEEIRTPTHRKADKAVGQFVDEITTSIRAGLLSYASGVPITTLSEYQAARLRLLASAIFTDRYDEDFCRAHEANILFKERTAVPLTGRERRHIFRSSIVAGESAYVPGWYALPSRRAERVAHYLGQMAREDTNADIRKNAIRILRFIVRRTRYPVLSSRRFLGQLLEQNKDGDALSEALEYFGLLAPASALDMLGPVIANAPPNVVQSAEEARLRVLLRESPSDFLLRFEESSLGIPHRIRPELNNVASKIDPATLLVALKSKHDWVREIAARELHRRGMLGTEDIRQLKTDSDGGVRQVAYIAAIEQGERPSEEDIRKGLSHPESPYSLLNALSGSAPDKVIDALYQNLDYEHLAKRVDFYSLDGASAYRAIGLRFFPMVGAQVRQDLDDDFAQLEERSLQAVDRIYQSHGGRSSFLAKWKPTTMAYLRTSFRCAAASIIAKYGDKSDLERIRKLVDNFPDEVTYDVVDFLATIGDETDAARLIGSAAKFRGQTCSSVARAILRLVPGAPTPLLDRLDSGSAVLSELVLAMPQKAILAVGSSVWLRFLSSGHSRLRICSLRQLVEALPASALKRMLNRYVAQDSYYYDVVFWMDRLCLSPKGLRPAFVDALEDAIRVRREGLSQP